MKFNQLQKISLVNKIGLEIKSKRKSLGLTQLKFAKLLGVAQGYLSELENGLKVPSNRLLLSLRCINKSQESELLSKNISNLQRNIYPLLEKLSH